MPTFKMVFVSAFAGALMACNVPSAPCGSVADLDPGPWRGWRGGGWASEASEAGAIAVVVGAWLRWLVP